MEEEGQPDGSLEKVCRAVRAIKVVRGSRTRPLDQAASPSPALIAPPLAGCLELSPAYFGSAGTELLEPLSTCIQQPPAGHTKMVQKATVLAKASTALRMR